MSLSAQQAYSFFEPLRGKTTTFMIDNRQTNLLFAKSIISLIAVIPYDCAIFDVNAFYSSNSEGILSILPPNVAKSTHVHLPEPGSTIETTFSRFVMAKSKVLIVDGMNTLYHLFSPSNASSRSRKLAFAIASLSYFARSDGKVVLLTMYKQERVMGTGKSRSISNLSDSTVLAESIDSGLSMKCERGLTWLEGKFSLRIP